MDSITELRMARVKLRDTGHLDNNRAKAFDDAIESLEITEWLKEKNPAYYRMIVGMMQNDKREKEVHNEAISNFESAMCKEFDRQYADMEIYAGSYIVKMIHKAAEQLKG